MKDKFEILNEIYIFFAHFLLIQERLKISTVVLFGVNLVGNCKTQSVSLEVSKKVALYDFCWFGCKIFRLYCFIDKSFYAEKGFQDMRKQWGDHLDKTSIFFSFYSKKYAQDSIF